jgi:hypothetical protein
MAIRNTQTIVEALTDGDPKIRNTQTIVEALTDGDPKVRNTQTVVEVLEATNYFQLAQQFVQVISNNDPSGNEFQLAQQFIQIISKNPIATQDFTGSDNDPPDLTFWSITNGTPTIQSNELELLVNSSNKKEGVKTKKLVGGDFEIVVDVNVDEYLSQDNWSAGVGVQLSSSEYFEINREYDNVNGHDIVVRTADGGSETVYRISDTTTDTKLKIKKEGNTFKGWYWDGTEFVQVNTSDTVGLSPDEFWSYMVAETNNNEAQLRILVDKFTVLSGYFADAFLQNVYITIIQ